MTKSKNKLKSLESCWTRKNNGNDIIINVFRKTNEIRIDSF